MALSCLNCAKRVEQEEGKLFAQCFVCPDCYRIAARLYDQSNAELKFMLQAVEEIIRGAILRRQLTLPPPSSVDSNGQVVEKNAVQLLLEMLKKETPCPTLQLNDGTSSVTQTTR